ncbi:hypothetical protein [Parapedobacter sp. DT-150]|uniref:hypothetical protein n=1 Tax=Parapedobacter sp. DT-150 TaxID=3396162 RepID=UPI003F1DCF43
MNKIIIGLLLLFATNVNAQEKMATDTTAVHSIDGIVKAVLHIISGEEGKARDIDAFRNLFLPTARLTVLTHNPATPYRTLTVDEFIQVISAQPSDRGFREAELGKTVDEYNGIAHVFQSYHAKDNGKHDEKGINSLQLIHFNDRWWIANIVWTGDSNGIGVPPKYLD